MITKRELIEGYYKAQESGHGQWWQRWSTMTDMHGSVYLKLKIGDPYEHYPPLDGLIEHHSDIKGLRRWEWYAIRWQYDDHMELYRFSPGSEVECLNFISDLSTKLVRAQCVFRTLFLEAGGFRRNATELHYAEREADNIRRSSMFIPR